MDIYEKHRASIEDWVKSYQTAKVIMDFPSDVDLSFERSGTLASVRMSVDKVTFAMNGGCCININPYLVEINTSENLRQFIYSHEIGEITLLDPLTSICFCLARTFRIPIVPISRIKERQVNRKVYDSFCKKSNSNNASERMRKLVEEWLDLRPEDYGNKLRDTNEYIKKYMPFLM